ncbi:Carbohydrate esterase 4 protein [Tulasnella sp. 403]|nr:Carbohydrate esterase 4 protein [Tulasnella sp. 403]
MFSAPRILAALFAAATLVSAAPANITERELPDVIELESELEGRASLAKVYTKCSVKGTVALTFDDGPYKWNKLIVDTLNQNNAKGTFFVNGNNYECIYSSANVDRLKHAYSSGHQIASHTWSHADMTQLAAGPLKKELTKLDTALKKIIGIKPAFVRPPYGNYDDNARAVAKSNGQSLVTWDFDSGDSVGATVSESETAYKNLANKKPSSILALNHETETGTAHTLLPYAIKTLKAKGYKFVTVAQCLGVKDPYLMHLTPQTRDSSWKC